MDDSGVGNRRLKRERDSAGADPGQAMVWDEEQPLPVTPVGHDWGGCQAAARSLKLQLARCSLALLHVDSGAGTIAGWLWLLLPDLHPPALAHLDLPGLVTRLPQLVAAAGLQVRFGVRTAQGRLRWQAAAGGGYPIAPIVLQVGVNGRIEAVAAVGPTAMRSGRLRTGGEGSHLPVWREEGSFWQVHRTHYATSLPPPLPQELPRDCDGGPWGADCSHAGFNMQCPLDDPRADTRNQDIAGVQLPR
eukprot:882565-Rhodomonas_salina.1